MGLHKLTAGDGYLYLIRQVAAADATQRGCPSLSDYYSAKGEAPGAWLGRGLAALGAPASRDAADPLVAGLWGVPPGSPVSEDQMKALFGEGLHPNADKITRHLTGVGVAAAGALAAARLGRPFPIRDADNEFTRRLRAAYRDYNTAVGHDPNAAVAPEIRARIRTALGREMFAQTHGRPPADDRELTGFIARHTRAATTAVAGYDLTFTPVKSVSALWALAPGPIARAIEDCHHRAVADTLEFLEDQAAFARIGAQGVAQVDTTGLIAAAFDHRDSRAGDPNLHTHLVISNKVQARGADGIPRWLALDGTPLHHAAVAASEFYNTRTEALLAAAIGVRFAAAPTRSGKRPVREIAGVPAELIQKFSSRSAAIEHRVGQLAKQFQTAHGREPTVVEMLALSQQATLETRQAKHEPRSLAEQRHTWRTQAIEVLGSQRALTAMVAEVTGAAAAHRAAITTEWVDAQAARVIATVARERATWTVNHVRAEAQRLLRYTQHPGGPDVAQRIVAAALGGHSIALSSHADTERDEPAALRRRDGSSVYTRHDCTLYTSAAVLAAERRILAAAALRGGRTVDQTSIELALLEHCARRGVALNAGQAAMVRDMAVSGARVQLALAPAGTGKTTAMATLAAAWRNGGGSVLGLAPTAGAAEVLGEDLGAPTDTVAKLVQLSGTADGPPAPADDPARSWFDTIGADTLLIVDEAGMAATADLDTLIGHALARGASVRLIGDDRQLAAIGAGGVLRDLAERPDTVTLSTVVRFTHPDTGPAEAAASLAVRAGDPAGIGFYLDHHRVHVGAEAAAADLAYAAWAADRAAGRDSILLAPTHELVAALNARARLDRLTRDTQPSRPAPGATVTLADGLTASAGDVIATRKNARWLAPDATGSWVKNGHRWTIRTVHGDGSLTVVPLRGRATPVRLPARYVAAHTTLGYASTINAAQGVTAGGRGTDGTCHTVISDRLTRDQLYVALTRGRTENHLYGSTSEADPHRILAPKATHPPTAADVLTAILGRDGAQRSAHSVAAADADPFTRLHRAAAMYSDALGAAAEQLAGRAVMSRIDAAGAALGANVTDAPAWPVLRRHLALLAADGHDPARALAEAARAPLDNAYDPAAVLDWRLPAPPGTTGNAGPLRWLPPLPDTLCAHPAWGPYLLQRAQLVTDLAERIRGTARTWEPHTAPSWARPLLARRPALMAEIAVFRAAHGVDPADTRLTGPEQHANRSAVVQQLIHARLDAELTRAGADTARWRRLAHRLDTHITADPFWPRLATHLDDAARAGADVAALLHDAASRHGPLPDEMPAAALWWRLAGTLAPPCLQRPDTKLRPPWTAELHHLLGTRITEAVLTDPAWPALVAAVAASDWPPADLLAAAAEHLRDIAAAEPLRPDQYARLLTYRVELLTHHAATVDPDIPHPADAAEMPSPGHQLDLVPGIPHPADILDEPPPDPYGFAEDDLAGLDLTDLARHRPTPTQHEADVDIPALRARRDAARRHVHRLEAAILRGTGGPAEHAAAAELAEMHRRHHQQRPLQRALARAHARWVHAEDTAELHHRLLDQIAATATAAARLGDHPAAARYRKHRDHVAQQSDRIDAAVRHARERLDAARAELLGATGGPESIVTDRDIQDRRAAALRTDTDALAEARRRARDLDDQLARAEALAARAFAENPARSYDLAADLPRLRAEVELLEAARGCSPAALYTPPTTALVGLDDPHRRAVAAIGDSALSVQLLHCHPGADKVAALAALAATAQHHQGRVLALPASPAAAEHAPSHRYSDTTTPDDARANVASTRWSLPSGSLVIVDDADHLPPERLRWLVDNATATNTKLLLVTTPDAAHRDPSLLAVLAENLPSAHHIGTPDQRHQQRPTAIQRVEHHLATTGGTSPEGAEASRLLQRSDRLLDRLREMTDTTAHIGAMAAREREYTQQQRDHGNGLEL
ncbi:relaxase domain-containing protein [Mycobacterium simiae]|uniref:Relaxase domain-containing protein n=1 Tax=Mycobacterium simiae TaxID=1784 RepID=A0A5B1BQ29_MYCSI|nr:MobF family relaxase [Mycobacterium simiae]KAA1250181.1 relaxase domain-containing protein [Mycobacterium simiae]